MKLLSPSELRNRRDFLPQEDQTTSLIKKKKGKPGAHPPPHPPRQRVQKGTITICIDLNEVDQSSHTQRKISDEHTF